MRSKDGLSRSSPSPAALFARINSGLVLGLHAPDQEHSTVDGSLGAPPQILSILLSSRGACTGSAKLTAPQNL